MRFSVAEKMILLAFSRRQLRRNKRRAILPLVLFLHGFVLLDRQSREEAGEHGSQAKARKPNAQP
jgi:hypothetical protein